MSTVTIVQARMSSRRLPGKSLMKIGPRTLLGWTLHRVSQSAAAGVIVVATSTDKSDNPIVALCKRLGVECFRGSLKDVLARYHACAASYRADTVIRVTADCPLVCPALLTEMAAVYRDTGADYAAVVNAPQGLTGEMMSMEVLTEVFEDARTPVDREHVVTYILDRQSWFDCRFLDAGLGAGVFTVDTAADLARLRGLYGVHGDGLFEMTGRDLAVVDELVAA